MKSSGPRPRAELPKVSSRPQGFPRSGRAGPPAGRSGSSAWLGLGLEGTLKRRGRHAPARMHPHAALVERFYASFAARDAEGMAACYHDEVVFTDPAFGELRGERARDMWRMLLANARDLRVEASDVRADDAQGSARWVATYSFGKARRRVRNVIRARFAFRDGLIARHEDAFSLWKWAGMALGPLGWALGWTPVVRGRIRADARRRLETYVQVTP